MKIFADNAGRPWFTSVVETVTLRSLSAVFAQTYNLFDFVKVNAEAGLAQVPQAGLIMLYESVINYQKPRRCML